MPKRLSDQEFERIQKIINHPTDGVSVDEMEKRRDFLLDLAEMVSDSQDKAKYNI